MSQRLTKDQKQTITNKVLNKTFTDRQAALNQSFIALGDSIYDALYGCVQAVLADVPKNFLSLSTTLPVHFDGASGRWGYDHIPMSVERAIPASVQRGHATAASYDQTEPFGIEHKRLCEIEDQLSKDRELLKKHLNGLFYSVNTRKQALAAWPECEPFLPADVPVVKNLPALPTHDLNALIARMKGGE